MAGFTGPLAALTDAAHGEWRVVADGPAREVLSGSLFAPQVLRVLPPFLTVDEVAAARAAEARP